MRTNETTNLHLEGANSAALPMYFNSGESQLFGWLHLARANTGVSRGVVICNPFGFEYICAHRSVREYAEKIAAAGIHVLRFDYLGTGDSADSDEGADHIAIWSNDIIAAVNELKRLTGVDRICLLGIRFGALLAALTTARCPFIDTLIMVGPIVNGRRYLRELRTAQLAGQALTGGAGVDRAAVQSKANRGGGLEAGGFTMSAATMASLALVNLQTSAAPTVGSMLIIDSDKLPSGRQWADSLSGAGVNVEYKIMHGLIDMVMTAPHLSTLPLAMIAAAPQWLATLPIMNGSEQAEGGLRVNMASRGEGYSTECALVLDASIRERPVFIPANVTLFGVITESRPDENRRRGVVLLNSGVDFHIGPSRVYVSLARRWARNGYFVLRLDLTGIGDSATKVGTDADNVFPESAVDDIRRALEFMRSRYGISEMTLAGLCSGAYHALRAAALGVRVNRILMVNPLDYFWEKGRTLEQITPAEVVRNPSVYRQRVLSLSALIRLASGQVDIVRIMGIYLRRFLLIGEYLLRELMRRLQVRLPNDLGWDLEKIASYGVRVILIFARGEPGIALLNLLAGSAVSRLGRSCTVRILDHGDHIFSRRESRNVMEDVLSEELFATSRNPEVEI